MVIRWNSRGLAVAIARLLAVGAPRRRIVPCEPLAQFLWREQRVAGRRDALAGAGFMAELGSRWTDVIRSSATCPPLDMPKGLGRGYFFPGPPRAG